LAGDLTPEVARDWENACTTYFMHKGVEAKDQVKMVAFGMLDPRLHTWYLTRRTVLDAGTFKQYMTALRNDWLEKHWATKLRKKVLGSQQGTRPFYEWALELQNQNALLYGNKAYLEDDKLRDQLEANTCDELTVPVLRADLAEDLSLREWIEEVNTSTTNVSKISPLTKKSPKTCTNQTNVLQPPTNPRPRRRTTLHLPD
jgi:hypothetical protein